MIPLRKAVQPGAPPDGRRRYPSALPASSSRGEFDDRGAEAYRAESQLYVATPAVLRYLGIDPATVDPSTDFLVDRSVPTDELVIPSMSRAARSSPSRTSRGSRSAGTCSAPTADAGQPPTFITLDGLRRHGWKQIPAGWLVESSRPLTSDQIADARELAADAGLTIEVQRESDSSRRSWRSRRPRARSWRSPSSR